MSRFTSSVLLGLAATLALPATASPLSNIGPKSTNIDSVEDWIVVRPDVTDTIEDRRVRDYWTAARIHNISSDERLEDPPPITDVDLSIGQEYPHMGSIQTTVGRLLFTAHDVDTNEPADSSCTATLVESENQATLVTAAHCIHASIGFFHQGYHANLLWVPGFRDGEFPLGAFTVNSVVHNSTWLEIARDADRAFIVLNPDAQGRPAGETLGQGQQLKFDPDLPEIGAQRWHLGYTRYFENASKYDPRKGTPAFTGDRLASCNGSVEIHPFMPETNGVSCRMSGGSSGGPGFDDFDVETGRGTITVVNSVVFGTWEDEDFFAWMFGTNVTDSSTQSLWEKAQSLKVEAF